MKFLRVEVDNWRPFRGASAMNIAAADDRPITLVFGKNGGGKTALLNAIYWCLYGSMDLEEDKGDQNLVNDHAVQDLGATKDHPARATVVLFASHTAEGTPFLYRIERSQSAYETNGARTEEPDGLKVERIDEPEDYSPGDDITAVWQHQTPACFTEGQATGLIEGTLLAEGLAKYFFYPGETLSFPFKGDDHSRGQLKEFLCEISGRGKFKPYTDTISEACKILKKKSKSHADADKKTQGLQAEIEQLEVQLESAKRRLPDARDERDAAISNREGVEAHLSEMDAFKEVLATATTARERLAAADQAVEAAERSLSEALSHAYLCVAAPILATVIEVFDRSQYPSDVSRTLVEQIKATNECICERPLEDGMLERIEAMSQEDDSVATRMISLRSHAARVAVAGAQTEAVDIATVARDEALDARSQAAVAYGAAEERVRAKGADRFRGVDESDLVATRHQIQQDIEARIAEIARLDANIQHIEQQIATKTTEKRAAAPKTDQAVHRASEIAEEMSAMLGDISLKQADVARGQLADLIQRNYVIYKSNLKPSIDPNYRVQVHETRGDERLRRQVADLSGAETSLLTYAFAAAAARLIPQYQTLRKLLTTIPEFGDVEHIPLVVDAPFTSLGPEYKRRVMELMTRGFSQVIMFTEATKEDVEALEDAADEIGEEYLIRFEGDLDTNVETTFEWRGRLYTYAAHNSAEITSTLEPIGAQR